MVEALSDDLCEQLGPFQTPELVTHRTKELRSELKSVHNIKKIVYSLDNATA